MMGGEDHSGSADAALGPAAFKKSFLQYLQVAVSSKAFDRDDFCTVCLKHRNEAAIDQHSVQQNGAGAALALATSLFRSCQTKLMPKDIQEARHRVDTHGFQLSVHR